MIAFKLTKNQKEILHLLLKEFLTPKDIASRRGISKQSVYKTIRKLKEKGAIISLQYNHYQRGLQFGGVLPPLPTSNKKEIFRYHSHQFKIDYLGMNKAFFPGVGSQVFIKGNRITVIILLICPSYILQ